MAVTSYSYKISGGDSIENEDRGEERREQRRNVIEQNFSDLILR